MKIKVRKEVQEVINILEKYGFEVFLVGGAIRNQLLKIPVKDWDLTTNALPEEMVEIFNKAKIPTIPTGLKHGTITVCYKGLDIEITTYRIDGKYLDNRRPDKVEFTNNLKADLSRRDFTINALAYNKRTGLIDYFKGIEDIKKKELKCIGSAENRFSEDALRMLRAIRFANVLDFSLDLDIKITIKMLKQKINNVSVERIQQEFNKVITTGKEIKYFDLLIELLPNLFSENVNKNKEKCNLFLHFSTSTSLVKNLTSLFLYDILNVEFLKDLKYSNSIRKQVESLKNCYQDVDKSKIYFLGENSCINYNVKRILLEKYDISTIRQAISIISVQQTMDIEVVGNILLKLDEILKNGEPIFLKDLDINGNDIKEYGYRGIEIGRTLKNVQNYIWKHPKENKRKKILEWLNKK